MNLNNYHPKKCNIAPEVAAALIAGGSSIAGTAMSAGNQNQINTNNQALARQQNQWNLAQWYRENAYNTPSAQKQRLKEAGINPGLMYSNGIENLAAQSPHMVSSQNQASARFDLGGIEAMQAYQNSKLTASQVDLNEAQADELYDRINDRGVMRDQRERELRQQFKESDKKIEEIDAQISFLDSEKQLNLSKKTAQDFINKFNEDTRDLQIADIEAGVNLKIAQTEEAKAHTALYNAQTANEQIAAAINRIALMDNKIDFMRRTAALYLFMKTHGGMIPDFAELESTFYKDKESAMCGAVICNALSDPDVLKDFKDSFIGELRTKSKERWWRNSWYGTFWNDIVGQITSTVGFALAGNANLTPSKTVTRESKTVTNGNVKRSIIRYVK